MQLLVTPSGKMVPPNSAKALLEAIIRPGDRVCLEGDNEKQADFLADVLAGVDQSRITISIRAIGNRAPGPSRPVRAGHRA